MVMTIQRARHSAARGGAPCGRPAGQARLWGSWRGKRGKRGKRGLCGGAWGVGGAV